MALPLTGPLSLSQVNTELGRSAGATISLGDAGVRGLAGVAGGAIGLGTLRGKSNAFAWTITSNIQELDVHAAALARGWNGSAAVTVTIGSGVYIWSDDVAVAALRTGGAYPGGLTLINRGFIMGKGGAGASNATTHAFNIFSTRTNGVAGGPAIALSTPITIDNAQGYIGGGGGGGSSGLACGGGGAGGGLGGGLSYVSNLVPAVVTAPAPPSPGQPGSQNLTQDPNHLAFNVHYAQHTGAGGAGGNVAASKGFSI
ncbi:hypothetical protein [Celeribacter marinus]|uniref:Glycine-rich cell wall structural protein 1 n=1 Tax=Celeribacter marinus TaxID=1397108 RepID=A0A0P0AC69_9RHOB|nr:hypothetical protein [Celeribacter marinus]ALI55947.1 glycine-rich cell wall structural protein 1 precursor [Celeribacter marinus]SFL10356.1 hypothetical protein SAMN05444421_1242 [Celeribacter marinus]